MNDLIALLADPRWMLVFAPSIIVVYCALLILEVSD